MPDFEFVHVDRPGDEKKQSTKIRRHVMKDIGKARRKPKNASEITAAPRPRPQPMGKTSSGSQARRRRPPLASVSDPLVECKLSTITFPVEMDEERRTLARFIFAEAASSYRPFRRPWLALGLRDAAAWYITLAYGAISREVKPGFEELDSTLTERGAKWYSLGIQSISRRLEDPRQRSNEGVISAVTGFVCHDSVTGNYTRRDIHFEGLKTLVDDIGGINKIKHPVLRFLISWYDLSVASCRGNSPSFEVPEGSITDTDTGNDAIYFKLLIASWNKSAPYLRDIQGALEATAAVASYINRYSHSPKFWTDDMLAARLLAPALHAVLSLKPRVLPNSPSHPACSGMAAREAFKRSSLIFLTALKAKFGGATFELDLHVGDFRQISQSRHVNWSLVPELNLWSHTIAALAEVSDRRSWHILAIVKIMEGAGFSSSRQVLDVVKGIIWAEALFADRVVGLCYEIDDLITSRSGYHESEPSVDSSSSV